MGVFEEQANVPDYQRTDPNAYLRNLIIQKTMQAAGAPAGASPQPGIKPVLRRSIQSARGRAGRGGDGINWKSKAMGAMRGGGGGVDDEIGRLMAMFGGGGSSSGGGGFDGSGYIEQAYAARMKAVEDSTNAAMGAIGNQRNMALSDIAKSYDQAKSGITAGMADYAKQADAVRQTQVADTAAISAQNAAQTQARDQFAASQGFNPTTSTDASVLAAGDSALQQSANSQSALMARMDEINRKGSADTLTSVDQARQAGDSNVASNYNDIVARIMANKAQEQGQAGASRADALYGNAANMASAAASARSSQPSQGEALMAAIEAKSALDEMRSGGANAGPFSGMVGSALFDIVKRQTPAYGSAADGSATYKPDAIAATADNLLGSGLIDKRQYADLLKQLASRRRVSTQQVANAEPPQ